MAYFQNKKRNHPQKRVSNINELNSQLIFDILSKQNQKIGGIKSLKDTDKNKNQKFDLLQITGKQVVNFNNNQKVYERSNSQKSPKYDKQVKEIKIMLQSSPQKMRTIVDYNLQKKQREIQLFSTGTYYTENRKQITLQSKYLQNNLLAEQKQKDANYYQKMILQDPVLYNKVINAYKCIKRQNMVNSQKQVRITKKRTSVVENKKRTTAIENKMAQKNKQYDNISQHQRKRLVSFSIYREMLLLINYSNKQYMVPQKEGLYRAFIGKGNNGLLIKSILKSRPWWCIRTSSDIQTCNLIWTQWKNPKLMKYLPEKETRNCKIQNFQYDSTGKQSNKISSIKKLVPNYICNELNKYLQTDDLIQGYTKFNKKICDEKSMEIVPKMLTPQNNYFITNVSKNFKLINHIPGCFQLHSKKLLFTNMKKYYEKLKKNVFDYLPHTFLISKGVNDQQFQKFKEVWKQSQKSKNKKNKNIWICKPGQNSNRGNGITVVQTLEQIKNFISSHSSNSGCRTTIIQKYMENPFLYNKRKFDIRCYILITTVNGIVKGYWYQEGYIRTTSRQFNLKNLDNKFVHLTNDAIQKKGDDYGKFENFNKVSFQEFQKYLQANFSEEKYNFQDTLQKMKIIATDLINSVGSKLNPEKKEYAFEIFGLDFMLDDCLQPVILQANSNPCIQVDGPVLGRIIPTFLQNMIRIAIDPIFQPPFNENPKTTKFSAGNTFEQNKFSLVYDSITKYEQQNGQFLSKDQLQQQALFDQEIALQDNQF